MNLGARLLRDLPIGLQDNQQDVDVHTTPAFHARPYVPNEDGYLVERDTGLPVQSQKYAYDDLYKEVDLDWDQVFANDPDYQFACEVAGFVNVSVESLGDRGANEHRAAQRKQQEQLLIDERKARLIAFKDRVQELEKVREERRVTEAVRTRLTTLHQQSFRPTVERWYWLGSMTGTGRKRRAVPYWLLTTRVSEQYVSPNVRRDRFANDTTYFEASDNAHAWTMTFLQEFNAGFARLLSLTADQLQFAYQVYLAFRDSVFAQVLNLTGAGPASQRRYDGLLGSLALVHATVAQTIAPTAVRQKAVTFEEVDTNLSNDDLQFPDVGPKASEKSPLDTDRLPFTTLLERLFAPVANAQAMFDDDAKRKTFVDDGITLGFDTLLRKGYPAGLSPSGFPALLDVLNATIASPKLSHPGALALLAFLLDVNNSLAPITRTFTPAFLKEDKKEQWKVLCFALLCHADASGQLAVDITVWPRSSGDSKVTFEIRRSGITLATISIENLTPDAVARLPTVEKAVDTFLANSTIDRNGRELVKMHVARLLLSVLFWNTALPTANLQTPLLNDLIALVQRVDISGSSNKYADLRKDFKTQIPLLVSMTGPDGPAFKVITGLRLNYGLAAHFMRELFRSTFAEKYARTNIDPSILVVPAPAGAPAPAPGAVVTFVGDVRAEVDTIDVLRPAAPLPPAPLGPLLGLPPALAAAVAPVGAAAPPPRLNDPALFETWEKLYANLFYQNPNEPDPGLVGFPGFGYWRQLFRTLATQTRRDKPGEVALGALWSAVLATGPRFFTSRQQRLDGTVADFSGLSLKLTQGEDEPDNPVALRFEDAFRLRLAAAAATATPIPNVPGLGRLLQTMLFYEDVYYPWAVDEVNKAVADLTTTQQRMVQVLQDALTNTNTSVVKELKDLAAGTYIPDPRFHMQAKYVGRFKFSAQFLSAVRAAYSDLQSLARTSAKLRALNDDGRRPRPLPYDYSPLENVPMDVLTCNTDSAGGTREYIDLSATDHGIFTQLRSCMAAMVAQHIFAIRLDAPDEYKSVVQHRRSPQQLKAAQQAMTQFVFYRTTGKGWRAALV